MNRATLRTIIILVSLLFLDIEAAHAGLIQKFRVFILQEFPGYQWLYLSIALLSAGFLAYVVFTPVVIGKEKWAWLNVPDYQARRQSVSRISEILQEDKEAAQRS